MAAIASIVIPHYGRQELVDACVAAIERTTVAGTYELIIVDNGTGHRLPGRVVRNLDNLGFAKACNLGAQAATADTVVFLNNDTEPEPGWLPPLVEAAWSGKAAMTGSLLVTPDGQPELALPGLIRRRDGRLSTRNDPVTGPTRTVPFVCGACIAVRRAVFLDVGGFDEGYWNGHEDIDLCLKMRMVGWEIVLVAESKIMHRVSQSGSERTAQAAENGARLHAKWTEAVAEELPPPHPAQLLYRRSRRTLARVLRR